MKDLKNIDYESTTELCTIMKKNGSDKSLCHHNYTVLYSALFSQIKEENLSIFEMGLGTNNVDVPSNMGANGIPGASLRGWKEYFRNSLIYGGDIDKRILFTEDRIKTYFCDQTSPEKIMDLFNRIDKQFDIIIDDGLHTYEANICMLENSIHFLKKGGTYIIEDVREIDFEKFEVFIKNNIDRYEFLGLFKLPNKHNIFNDNNLVLLIK